MTVKRVAIDVDGPQYEWDKTARYMLRVIRGCLGLDEPSREWLLPDQDWHSVTKADWQWLWTDGVKQGLFRYGHVTRGAIIGVRALVAKGFKLEVVTHRPSSAIKDTLAWLDLVWGDEDPYPWESIKLLTNEEPKTISQAHVLIDDKPANCKEWAASGRMALLFSRPWNMAYDNDDPNIFRVLSWEGVVRALCS